MGQKLAHRLHPHAALEARGRPGASTTAGRLRFPRIRIPGAAAALQGLLETMHTTLRQTGLLGNASHALCPVVTKTLENPYPVLWIAPRFRLIYGCPCYTNGGGEILLPACCPTTSRPWANSTLIDGLSFCARPDAEMGLLVVCTDSRCFRCIYVEGPNIAKLL